MEWLYIIITILGITTVAFVAKIASKKNISAGPAGVLQYFSLITPSV